MNPRKIALIFLFLFLLNGAFATDFLPGFEYRIPLTVVGDDSYSFLTQQIDLNSSTLGDNDNVFWANTQSDGDDIRFTDSNNNELDINNSVWVDNSNASFLVSFPEIVSGDNNFFIYFGNDSAVADNNTSLVANVLLDDFEDNNVSNNPYWRGQTGTPSTSSTQAYSGTYSMTTDSVGGKIYTTIQGLPVDNNYSLWVYSGGSGNNQALLEIITDNNVWADGSFRVGYYQDKFQVTTCDSGYTNTGMAMASGNWFKITINYVGGASSGDLYLQNSSGAYIGKYTRNLSCPFTPATIGVYEGDGINYFDDIFYGYKDYPYSFGDYETSLGVASNFDYTIDKTNSQIILEDTSTTNEVTIDDWDWFVDSVKVSDLQDYNYATTQLQDLNVCLFVEDSTDTYNDISCQQFNTGDWEAPVTTLSTTSVTGTEITTLTFSCTDNNSGCTKTYYNINSEGWLEVANTGTADINYTGTGSNSVQYFSTDDNDNNESTKTDTWAKYGYVAFNFYDEDSENLTSTTLDFNGTEYTGTTFDMASNLIGTATNTTKTFEFTKTDYGTRYYTIDFNHFTVINENIMMLANTNGRNIEFQVYAADQTTKYANNYIQMFNHNKNDWVAGRRKTDADGFVTFFLNPNDENYTMRIFGTTTVDYNSMTLTVNKPKDELTGLTIDGNWSLDVTGLAWQNYSTITEASQDIMIYANTSDKYGLTVGDENANYYDRKYYVGYVGATTSETLQPYLVPIASAVSTTIYTISGYTQQPVGNIEIKIYKTIADAGRVLVEQVVTDAKGEALISLVANEEYEFEIYNSENELLGNQVYSITSTSTTIYISVDDLSITTPEIGNAFVDVSFTPNRGYLIGVDDSISVATTLTDYNYGITFTSMTIWVTNTDVNGTSGNDVNLFVITTTSQDRTFTLDTSALTLDGNAYDDNGTLIFYVMVTTSQGVYYEKHIYKTPGSFDWHRAISYDLRPAFGCSSTTNPFIPCPIMLLIAIFVSFLITIGFAMETGFTGTEGMAGIFLGIMGIFTYFAWVPIGLMALLVVSSLMLYFAIGGRNRL